MKKILKALTAVSIIAAPMSAIACSADDSDFATSFIKQWNTEKNLIEDTGIEAKSLPQLKTVDGKPSIKVGVTGNYLNGEDGGWDDGKWKGKESIRNASQRGLFDLIEYYNKINGNYNVEIVEFQDMSNLETQLRASNADMIPHLMFGGTDSLSALDKFTKIDGTVSNKANKLGIDSVLAQATETEINSLPLATEPLVGIVDYKLMNGLIYSYNTYLEIDSFKIMDDDGEFVEATDATSDDLYESTGNSTFDEVISLKDTTYTSDVFGDEALSYDRLKDDASFVTDILEGWSSVFTREDFFATDFISETIVGMSTVKGTEMISSDGDFTSNDTFADVSSAFLDNSKKGFIAKDTDLYNTTGFNDSKLIFDVTKGFAMNYLGDNPNLAFFNTPGFTYKTESALKVLDKSAEAEAAIEDFVNWIYNGTLADDEILQSPYDDGTTGTVGFGNNGETPLAYYAMLAKKTPASKVAKDLLDSSISTLDTYRLSTRNVNMFNIFSENHDVIVDVPTTVRQASFYSSLTTNFLKEYV